MFHLLEPPPAIVLKADTSAHIAVFKQLRNEFGSSPKRHKHLTQAGRQTKWLALSLRFAGLKAYKLAKKLFKLRLTTSKVLKSS